MIARAAATLSSVLAVLAVAACGTAVYETPIETPIQPKLDTSSFQRVLVVGFVAGGTEDVDANLETVRLLRSQLRTKSSLRVIEADAVSLIEALPPQAQAGPDGKPTVTIDPKALPSQIRDEKDLEAYNYVFENPDYWKKLGDEFQAPLIVTGSVLFTPYQRTGFVQRENEAVDAYGRRTVEPTRTYMERKGYILRPKFVFIDGRTGAVLHTEVFREEVLYNPNQETPALSSYFELMDRLIPGFLGTLSSQKIRGMRVLLR
jgi:hypothetical protein